MRLISATPSPWARKVRILLHEKAVTFELVNDIPWSRDTCVPIFNPLEKLPILITDDGETVYDSRLIVEWIERRFPEPPMVPADELAFLAVKRFEVLGDGVLDALLLFQFEKRRTHPDEEWHARQLRKIVGGLSEVARHVDDEGFAVSDTFTLADAALGAMLGGLDFVREQGRLPEVDWRGDHPSLARYFDRLQERPSLAATRPVMFDFNLAQA